MSVGFDSVGTLFQLKSLQYKLVFLINVAVDGTRALFFSKSDRMLLDAF